MKDNTEPRLLEYFCSICGKVIESGCYLSYPLCRLCKKEKAAQPEPEPASQRLIRYEKALKKISYWDLNEYELHTCDDCNADHVSETRDAVKEIATKALEDE